MKLHEGDHVKCFLRNATTIEGIVVEWSEDGAVLKSMDQATLLIIHRPGDDIMLTKIVLTEQTEPEPKEEIPSEKPTQPNLQQKVKEKLHEVQSLENDPVLQEKTIAELKQLVAEQDKQIIAQKTREHFGSVGSTKQTQYMSQAMLLKKGK